MAKEPEVSFEVFSSSPGDVPYIDNFRQFFWRGALSEFSRSLPQYEKFKKKAPDLEKRLREGISVLPSVNSQALEPFIPDLYRAYLLMREYVHSDSDLGLPPTK